ncbi:hypothetical protein [Glaciecola sp. 33A]|uniref:hypothetical protein n=1 Tax=Glaciecola sp. 33A TaxID=2057807 RepID=UPI0012FEE51B|nr:hypothetical protein [Glaciecola sp. 33A]
MLGALHEIQSNFIDVLVRKSNHNSTNFSKTNVIDWAKRSKNHTLCYLYDANGQLGDVAIFEDLVSLERSVVIGDIRFLIGLRSIADINTLHNRRWLLLSVSG